jgi:hypothetical protein
MKKQTKTIAMAAAFLAVGLLALSPMSFNPEGKVKMNAAEAKKKPTKWQRRLEKDQINIFFWSKYLPSVNHSEYKKAMKKYSKSLTASSAAKQYTLHQNITTTTFWIGEESGPDNSYISNVQSAWDESWGTHFGGADDPNNRNGYFPAGFTPKENPFYFALPYNDLSSNGNRKGNVQSVIPWASEKSWPGNESMCKNRWIKIINGSKVAYAQWEDVGPLGEDDSAYVFGTASPASSNNDHAGLDVSPGVSDYLGLDGMNSCSWQFVDAKDVPDGPWKQIVTTSNISWK